MEVKYIPQHTKSIDGRAVTGLFAVHGNIDSTDDMSWPGAFTKTMFERAGAIRHLWGHSFNEPPIAKIVSLREVTRDELPPSVLAKAPDATGGAEVVREYLNTPRGDEVLEGIKAGAIAEMSYGYDAVKFDYEDRGGKRVRHLREVKLYETSDVLWGANSATQSSKSISAEIERYVAYLDAFVKSGARHSASDIELINQIAANALQLGASNVKLIEAGKSAVVPARSNLVSEGPALDDLRAKILLIA